MLYNEYNDETLVMLTLAGEQRAYEELVSKYERLVISAAFSVTKNTFIAEDAAQDAFVTAWIKLDMLRERSKYGSWVCRIAKNCAKNLLLRYQNYLDIDGIEGRVADEGCPETIYAESEEKGYLHRGVSNLPERVGLVIRLHYFEQLSVNEIAQRLGVAVGTVKSQLNQGRKQLRKELCAMNEEYNDTLVKRVMKKVEELKGWKSKNSKKGFDAVYKETLKEVEELPECEDKYHALADVLMRGYWWIQKEKNDELFSRIKEAAELGKNEEVISFVCRRESDKFYGSHKKDFIINTQIPYLEKKGYKKALGHEWITLAKQAFVSAGKDEGLEYCKKGLSYLTADDLYYTFGIMLLERNKRYTEEYKDKNIKKYALCVNTSEFSFEGENLRRSEHYFDSIDGLYSVDREIDNILINASSCDGYFLFPELSVGESVTASDGEKYTFLSDNERVVTPAGVFEGCQKWSAKRRKRPFVTYYKEGVGIVKQESCYDGVSEIRLLYTYDIKGGNGLIPLCVGNRWEYCAEFDESVILQNNEIRITYLDEKKVIFGQIYRLERLRYDENSWLDMVAKVRNDYFVDGKVCDVYYPIERAEALAVTPMQKAHTKAMASVARRILNTDPEFNPKSAKRGRWNFFERGRTERVDQKVYYDDEWRWGFELKCLDGTYQEYPILFNDIYGILSDCSDCLWNDEWIPGALLHEGYIKWEHYPVETEIRCSLVDEIKTDAGIFENCLRVAFDIKGLDETGISYRGGKKTFCFAEGVGIVRFEGESRDGVIKVLYELAAYEGKGKGYMPLEDGMMRYYEAKGLTDGFEASARYTYCLDSNDEIVIFGDRTGVRTWPAKYTDYSTIYGETVEDELWCDGKHEESRLRHSINNFHLLCHFLGRPSRYWAVPEKAVEWNKYRMEIIEGINSDGTIPTAWLGHYYATCFRSACALFGLGRREEGYEYLEKAFELYPKWAKIKEGEAMDVGRELIYGGIKVAKDKHYIILPDGTKEPFYYEYMFDEGNDLLVYGMTAKSGWEWFDSVRNEELFKEYIKRAKKMQEENKA
ncbi:MAG: sigma-70 family RNA polymerase sigma factor [Clostridia bacterium]|nr:sigma-70 family RNA polymerase sigma factor [Clostridia bacterium]